MVEGSTLVVEGSALGGGGMNAVAACEGQAVHVVLFNTREVVLAHTCSSANENGGVQEEGCEGTDARDVAPAAAQFA